MKRIRNSLLMSAAVASLFIATTGTARADAFAQSILTIDNFRLLHSNDTPYSSTDFGNLIGFNAAHATASLNATTATAIPQTHSILGVTAPDLAHQAVGLPMPPRAENDFTPFASPPAVPGTFGYADQNMQGSALVINGNPSGALVQTRADASLASDGNSSGLSDVGTSTTFKFKLAVSESMRFTFDATPFTQAYATDSTGVSTNAIARLMWSINIKNADTTAPAWQFSPYELNGGAHVSRTDGLAGLMTYNPGTLSFNVDSPLLSHLVNYELTISHTTIADAMQRTAVPEPATLAIFGLGLLGMSAFTRRRKN